ncbi:hypothetical protein [Streptomyces sp. enrichment culture]|uniref:hypothetical protein n=1 Tax=Streptomyces sp. enrichment culture TaxID=1795815 RepID=UPI003F55166F
MGLSDQFKDKAKDLADQAKSALGDHNTKETQQEDQNDRMMSGDAESTDHEEQENESS